MNQSMALIISCEHAVNTIPKRYQDLFAPYQKLLESHRGIDFGALDIAKYLKDSFSCDFFHATTSRLLIDYNRSLHHPHCFSEITKNLSVQEKQKIISHYYLPYREQVIAKIDEFHSNKKPVLHLSIHSFTPIMNDQVRNADIGFLYDPQRPLEKNLAKKWQLSIKKQDPAYRVRLNYPYRGISDGFTSFLRQRYSAMDYLGIEIECNQTVTRDDSKINSLKHVLALSL